MTERPRQVHVRRGQRVEIHAGVGVCLSIEKRQSGAVELRNVKTNHLLRTWSPKEARER